MYIKVGRNPQSNIVITGYDVVSFDHATVEYDNGRFLFIDDSSNGTLVNGKLIHHASCPISQNDVIMLAGVCPLKWEQIIAQVPTYSSQQQMSGRPTQLFSNQQQYGGQNYGGQQQYGGQNYGGQQQYGDQNYVNQQQFGSQNNGGQQYGNPAQMSGAGFNQQGGDNSRSSSFDERDLDKWHWGAFFLSWIWGVFNNVYWPLIALIPIPLLSLVVSIIAGIKGRRQSWEKGNWRAEDYERFAKKQKNWSIAGFIVFGLAILSSIIMWSVIAGFISILASAL